MRLLGGFTLRGGSVASPPVVEGYESVDDEALHVEYTVVDVTSQEPTNPCLQDGYDKKDLEESL